MDLKTAGLALAAACALVPVSASAGNATAGAIEVVNAWAAPSAMVDKGMGAFMVLVNAGKEDDKLVAATSSVAPRATLHDHSGGGMTPLEAIGVPAGQSVMLKPGSLHVMFMNLDPLPREGSSFPLTLRFARAGETTVTVEVRAMPAMGGMAPGGTGPGGIGMAPGGMAPGGMTR